MSVAAFEIQDAAVELARAHRAAAEKCAVAGATLDQLRAANVEHERARLRVLQARQAFDRLLDQCKHEGLAA